MSSTSVADPGLTTLDRVLGIFTRVHAREGVTALLLMVNIFLILMAYYFIKPVREGWLSVSVIADLAKIEVKAYSAFGQSLLLLAILPVYAGIAAVLPRRRLITLTGAVCSLVLILFWMLQPGLLVEQVPFAGVLFYIFVGIFSVTLVAQFWSFASDLYGAEKGRRLFPLVAVGASSGAVAGSWLGERLVRVPWLESYDLILLSLVPLGCAISLARWIDRHGTPGQAGAAALRRMQEPAAPDGQGAYQAIYRSRYLGATAAMILIFNWIVTGGDNILFGLVQHALEGQYRDLPVDQFNRALNTATTTFYSGLYFWVNLAGLLLQAFLVSRLIQFGGFGLLIMTPPLVSLVACSSMIVAPVPGIIKLMKIAENSTNYSINNTARHMLWLPTTKAMMYQAKATIDTLFVRMGDGLAALTVLLGTRLWKFSLTDFLFVNMILSAGWILLAVYLAAEFRRLSDSPDLLEEPAR